jgi:ribosome biogenesis GTP-binding protein ysxC
MLKNMKFKTSAFNIAQLLETEKKQIVLVGKSNVGKSSFINSLANQKHLAKVGNTPGKTKSINYYDVNNEFYIVDLPGYGYSNMTKIEKLNTSKLINHYIEKNENISHILFLVDIRHKPTENDRIMYDWLTSKNIPFTIIATKADKIGTTKQKENMQVITKVLFAKENIIPFSSSNKLNLDIIENIILENIH